MTMRAVRKTCLPVVFLLIPIALAVDCGGPGSTQENSDNDGTTQPIRAALTGDPCSTAAQCNDGNPCSVDKCVSGKCAYSNQPDGRSCSDGDGCTTSDTCRAGVCVGGPAVVCAVPNQCQIGNGCNPSTGKCVYSAKTGATCDDGNRCTQNDKCTTAVAGVCRGSAIVCRATDACHDPGVCDSATGVCSNPPKPNGVACSDGNGCTTGDTCQAGTCTSGPPVVCAPPNQCQIAKGCNPSTGQCGYLARSGATCDDGNSCTQNDKCTAAAAGVCKGSVRPNGSACDDGNACTRTDSCQMGVCQGANAITCTALNACHVPGSCDPATGQCSNPNAPDGVVCDDANPCTDGDACHGGRCVGSGGVACAVEELTFDDNQLPSVHGWTFNAQDDNHQPVAESRVTTVSGGILHLDTVQIGRPPLGYYSDDAYGYWTKSLAFAPDNYFIEVRLRAEQPDGLRSGCGGLIGALVNADVPAGNYGTSITLMPQQVTFLNAPGDGCSTEYSVPVDGRAFHTYRTEVRGRQATLFIDGVAIGMKALTDPGAAAAPNAYFGDGSTSGGNSIVDIDYIRIGTIGCAVGSNGDGITCTATDPSWSQAQSAGGPAVGYGHASAYDPVRGTIVLHGTYDGRYLSDETWEWNGGAKTWTNRSPSGTRPPLQSDRAMAYGGGGKMILFGGAGPLNNDTWEWDGVAGVWTLLTPPVRPDPRGRHAMVYDSARNRIVLFGGEGGPDGLTFFDDVWEWDGANQTWAQQTIVGSKPPGNAQPLLAYDSGRRKVVAYGGVTASGGDHQIWDYDPAARTWTSRTTTAITPTAQTFAGFAYDPGRAAIVLFGGETTCSSCQMNETWQWNGTTGVWRKLALASAPSPRDRMPLVLDEARGTMLLFGGLAPENVTVGETWILGGS